MKKVLKGIGILLLILVLLIAAFFAFLTITQLDPKSEGANVNLMLDREVSDRTFSEGDAISVMSWNIGYSTLGKESDFFMDGGEQTRPDSKAVVEKNLQGIIAQIQSADADFSILQEVDSGSRRSYGVKETAAIADATAAYNPTMMIDHPLTAWNLDDLLIISRMSLSVCLTSFSSIFLKVLCAAKIHFF